MASRTVERYPDALIWMHWIMAVLIVSTIPIGWVMGDLEPGPTQDRLYHLHRSIGVTVLALACLRLALRLRLGAPPPEPSLEPWQRTASIAAHHGLYVLIFLVPLLGWAGTSAFGAPIIVWGLFELWPILPRSEALSAVLLGAHGFLASAMAGLALVHIGAALWHGFVRGDGVLQRMLPGGGA